MDQSLIGKKFTVTTPGKNPDTQYICKGFAIAGTILVVGAVNDTVNNRFSLVTTKIDEAKFFGVTQ